MKDWLKILYEERYNQALERAREMYKQGMSTERLEYVFPELEKSKDEKIIDAIKHGLKYLGWEHVDGIGISDMVAWLEKQGEQKPYMIQWKGNNLKDVLDFTGKNKNFDKWFKSFEEFEKYVSEHNNIFKLFNSDGSHFEVPIGSWIIKTPDGYNVASKAIFKPKPSDKVKPKFKVGDWITNGEYTWNVKAIEQLDYILKSQNGAEIDDNISYVDEEFHILTIEDAKDGDVLEFGDHGRLVVGIVSYINKTTGKVDVNCLLENNNFKVGNYYNLDTIKPHPATKEQRDLLFKKMKEAGYEWDAEKKELKKIEQKPVEWDESIIDETISLINKLASGYGEKVDEPITFNGVKMINNIKERLRAIKPQPKKEWSEEDEKIIERIVSFIWKNRKGDTDEIYQQEQDANWLKTIKDRVHPQPKQEWSKKDKANLDNIIWLCENCENGFEYTWIPSQAREIKELIKSLKPNHWKPSEEQLRALSSLLNFDYSMEHGKTYNTIDSLYNELKKL